MKLIVGLGNPGPRYALTRHNIGARVVGALAAELRVPLAEERFFGRFGAGEIAGERVGLLLPETWMNASGGSVAEAVAELPIEDVSRDLIVALDDVDLPFGRLRLRARGSSGGQRGLADVLAVLAREDVPRLRIGVGRSAEPARDTKDYVLDAFSPEENAVLPALIARAGDALRCFATAGIAEAANRFNGVGPPT
ncbi:MAG: aminoacyl-tRNA hydrolase [Deltaproteobacteria bacterium]|nr:aminoacyl-tRNA hydrolase [Deltaproteobacteria bacterium]